MEEYDLPNKYFIYANIIDRATATRNMERVMKVWDLLMGFKINIRRTYLNELSC